MLHKNQGDEQHEKPIEEASAPDDSEEDETAHKIVEIIIKDIKELNNNFTNKLAEIEKSVKNSRDNAEDLKKKVEKYDDRLDTIEKNIEKFIGLYEFVTNNLNPFIGEEKGKQPVEHVAPAVANKQTSNPQVIIEDSLSQESESVEIQPQKPVTKEEFTKQVSAVIGKQPPLKQPLQQAEAVTDDTSLGADKDNAAAKDTEAEHSAVESISKDTTDIRDNSQDTTGSSNNPLGEQKSKDTHGEEPVSVTAKEPDADFLKRIEHDIEEEIQRELEEKKHELSEEIHHELHSHSPKKLKDVARRLHFAPTIRPEKYFYLMNGQAAKSLDSLCNILRDISDSVFNHHVNHERNDFARWVEDVFDEYELAAKMRESTTRGEVVGILEHWLDEQYEIVQM